jgi:hypothetical protein
VAVSNDTFYVTTRNYLFQFDATTWGWIHLILGVLVAFAGWGLLSGWLPYYPFWALTLITLDVFVIWAATAHGGELRYSTRD